MGDGAGNLLSSFAPFRMSHSRSIDIPSPMDILKFVIYIYALQAWCDVHAEREQHHWL